MSDVSRNGERIDALDFEVPGASSGQAGSESAASGGRTNTTNKNTQIRPPGQTGMATHSDAPWWQSQFNLMIGVFVLLALAAGVFVLLTPPPTIPDASTVIATDGSASSAPASSVSTNAASDTTPWDESRRAQARTDSQDILSGLLESKKDLETKKVKEWAPQRYQNALDTATAGDELYKQQNYQQAIQAYTSAAEQMQNLYELIPSVLETKVKQGQEALSAGKSSLAKQLFKQALGLDVNDISALAGLGRAETLDQVISLTNAAAQDEQAFSTSDNIDSLNAAATKYQQAISLDKQAPQAITGAARVQELIADKQFRNAMSEGYQALFAKRYSSARSAFASALKAKPNDSTAKAAYRQSLASDKSSSLTSLLSAAQRYENSEQWSNALSNYQVVLQRDPNQVAAKLGQIRSRARSDLDQRLTEALDDPLLLAKTTQRERVSTVLSDARGITKKGPRLQQQIAAIEAAMQQSDTTINVTLSSDDLTQITLIKSGAKPLTLGTFANRKLALKPGRYVLSGRRLGFQDVRQELVLTPGESSQSFDIRCAQPVAALGK